MDLPIVVLSDQARSWCWGNDDKYHPGRQKCSMFSFCFLSRRRHIFVLSGALKEGRRPSVRTAESHILINYIRRFGGSRSPIPQRRHSNFAGTQRKGPKRDGNNYPSSITRPFIHPSVRPFVIPCFLAETHEMNNVAQMHKRASAHTHTHTHAHAHTYTHAHTRTHAHFHLYIYIYISTHTHIYANSNRLTTIFVFCGMTSLKHFISYHVIVTQVI